MIRTTLPRILAIQSALLIIAACTVDEPKRTAPAHRTVPRAEQRTATSAPAEDTSAIDVQEASLSESAEPASEPAAITAETVAGAQDALPEDLVGEGRRAFAEGDYERAVTLLEAASERGEGSDYERYLLGLACWKTGRLEQAETILVDVSWAMGEFARAPLNLARVRLDRGDIDGAAEAIEKALAIDPESADALNVLGRVRMARGDRDGAAEAFRHAMELDRENPWPANNLGYLSLVAGDAEQAVGALEQAVTVDPGLAIAWHNLALAREQAGDLPGAREAARQAAALSGDAGYETTLARIEALVPEVEPLAVAGADGDGSADVVTTAARGDRPE